MLEDCQFFPESKSLLLRRNPQQKFRPKPIVGIVSKGWFRSRTGTLAARSISSTFSVSGGCIAKNQGPRSRKPEDRNACIADFRRFGHCQFEPGRGERYAKPHDKRHVVKRSPASNFLWSNRPQRRLSNRRRNFTPSIENRLSVPCCLHRGVRCETGQPLCKPVTSGRGDVEALKVARRRVWSAAADPIVPKNDRSWRNWLERREDVYKNRKKVSPDVEMNQARRSCR